MLTFIGILQDISLLLVLLLHLAVLDHNINIFTVYTPAFMIVLRIFKAAMMMKYNAPIFWSLKYYELRAIKTILLVVWNIVPHV